VVEIGGNVGQHTPRFTWRKSAAAPAGLRVKKGLGLETDGLSATWIGDLRSDTSSQIEKIREGQHVERHISVRADGDGHMNGNPDHVFGKMLDRHDIQFRGQSSFCAWLQLTPPTQYFGG